MKTYDFPNGVIKRLDSGEYREIPKWCPYISVVRSRQYVLDALIQLRKFRKGST